MNFIYYYILAVKLFLLAVVPAFSQGFDFFYFVQEVHLHYILYASLNLMLNFFISTIMWLCFCSGQDPTVIQRKVAVILSQGSQMQISEFMVFGPIMMMDLILPTAILIALLTSQRYVISLDVRCTWYIQDVFLIICIVWMASKRVQRVEFQMSEWA